MTVVVETITPPDLGRIVIEVELSADIQITPTIARRRVNTYVSQEIADLLHGDTPTLIWREQGAFWRVPVVLSSASKGRIGVVGVLDIDVQTGDLIITDEIVQNIEMEAERLAVNAAL